MTDTAEATSEAPADLEAPEAEATAEATAEAAADATTDKPESNGETNGGLDKTASKDGENDSLLTVDEYEVDHEKAKEAAANIEDVDHLLDAPLDYSLQPTKGVQKPESSVYEKVKFHDEIGKLVLTDTKVTFHPYDGGSPTRGSFIVRNHQQFEGSHSWRWKMIKKHKISAPTSAKTQLKLISAENTKKAVVFTFYNRDQLELIRKDITNHMVKAHAVDPPIKEEASPAKNAKAPEFEVPATIVKQKVTSVVERATESTPLVRATEKSRSGAISMAREKDVKLNRSHALLAAMAVVILLTIASIVAKERTTTTPSSRMLRTEVHLSEQHEGNAPTMLSQSLRANLGVQNP